MFQKENHNKSMEERVVPTTLVSGERRLKKQVEISAVISNPSSSQTSHKSGVASRNREFVINSKT